MPRRGNDFRSLKEKYTSFTWSHPYGYDFGEVEETIKEYSRTISDMNELLIKKDEECSALKARCDDYVKTITEMQINYESLNVPEYSQEQSIEILDNFKNSESMSVPIEETPDYEEPRQNQRQNRQENHGVSNNRPQPVRQQNFETDRSEELTGGMDDKSRRVREDVNKRIIEDVDRYVISESSDIIT